MKRTVLLAAAFTLIATGCSSDSTTTTSDKPNVVASAYPLFEAVGTVGGERVHAANLVPLDPFAPLSQKQEEKLRDASLAVILGGGTQPHVEKIAVERIGPTVRILDRMVTKPAPPGSPSSTVDPSVWLDPNNMMVITDRVRTALTEVDPDGAKTYQKNVKGMLRMIGDLDRIHSRTIGTCKRRDVVSTSPQMGYWTDRFGLHQVPVSEETMASVVEAADSTTVFFEELPKKREAKELRREFGVRAATLDTGVAQTDQARRGGASYGTIMALNLDALRPALECTKVSLNK